MLTEAKKRANNKWDKENRKIVACNIRKDIAEQFSVVAKMNGTTPNEIIRHCILDYLATHEVVSEYIPNHTGETDEPADL